ncbi:MAG: SDR family NAD(P)-dependent oxidoreductase, partial [Bacilli bacterium]
MNKTVLVTASSRGIGRSVIIDFAKLGYNVVINYVNNKNAAFDLKKLVETTYKVQALVIKADISKEEEIINMIDCIIRKFKKIDVLINNAGIACDNYFLDK